MARNGSGTYNLPLSPAVPGTTATAAFVNTTFTDLGNALTQSLSKDGQTTPTANIPMGGFRLTGLGNATARTDAAPVGQVQNDGYNWAGTAGGTADALTLAPTPAITAYAAGQRFRFIASASNTGAATVAVSGLTATAIQQNGSALTAGQIATGKLYEVIYDGTQFQLTRIGALGLLTSDIGVTVQGYDASLASLANLSLVAGDVLYATGADTLIRLPIGTAGQFLTVNSGATAPEWSDSGGITLGTPATTTSGTAFDYTSIPSTAKRLVIHFSGVSLNGSDNLLVQIGPTGGFETTGYDAISCAVLSGSTGIATSTAGFIVRTGAAGDAFSGSLVIELMDGSANRWTSRHAGYRTGSPAALSGGGVKALAGVLDRVRITRTGTDTFDAGSVNITYE